MSFFNKIYKKYFEENDTLFWKIVGGLLLCVLFISITTESVNSTNPFIKYLSYIIIGSFGVFMLTAAFFQFFRDAEKLILNIKSYHTIDQNVT